MVKQLKKKKEELTIHSSTAEYLTYVASIGDQSDSIELRYEDENIWLTQKMMATLYDVEVNMLMTGFFDRCVQRILTTVSEGF